MGEKNQEVFEKKEHNQGNFAHCHVWGHIIKPW